jgi:site-specific DNA-methyltransferase (adenine-specific)
MLLKIGIQGDMLVTGNIYMENLQVGTIKALPRPPQPTQLALSDGKVCLGLIRNDALKGLLKLPSDTFNTVVTSPPYYWARDYGFDGQIGHEETAEQYVTNLANIFDEVRRVLHPEGVFYLNIGDTYYSGNGQPHGQDPRSPSRNFMRRKLRAVDKSGWDIPKKSLIGIPWKIAFELQSRGWTLRSDIIWNRLNAFAEPTARDRPYRQYEHVFLFSKNRFYSYDRSALGSEEDIWTIPIERGKQVDHNAPFPKELVRRCLSTGCPPGGFVLDPFVGSGTTLEVALDLGCHAVGIDLSEQYFYDVLQLLQRRGCSNIEWERFTPILATEPSGWNEWRGNKANFRKPGSTNQTIKD